jgi:hypothetical protein
MNYDSIGDAAPDLVAFRWWNFGRQRAYQMAVAASGSNLLDLAEDFREAPRLS